MIGWPPAPLALDDPRHPGNRPVCEAADDAFLPAGDPRYGTPCSEHCEVHGRAARAER